MSRGNLALRLPDRRPFAADERAALGTMCWAAPRASSGPGSRASWPASPPATTPQAQPAAAPRTAEPLLILYATESGNAEGVAAKLAATARRQGFKVTLMDVADATLGRRSPRPRTSSSSPPPGARASLPPARCRSCATLMAEGAPRFEQVRFAVLALGDRAYANFCSIGREIDARLEALGGTRIADRVDCDLDFAKPAASWGETALAALKPTEPQAGAEIIHLDFANPVTEPVWSREKPFAAEVLGPHQPQQLPLGQDHGPSRPPARRLRPRLRARRRADAASPRTTRPWSSRCSRAAGVTPDSAIETRLRRELDVTTLSRADARGLPAPAPAGRAGRAPRRRRLARLRRGKAGGRPPRDLAHQLDSAELLTLLRQLPARAYSIASSPLAYPDEAHLLVGAGRLRHPRPRPPGRGLGPRRPPPRQGRQRRHLSPPQPPLPPARDRRHADHHGRPRHRRGSLPRLRPAPPRAGPQGPELAVLRRPPASPTTSSTSSNGRRPWRRARSPAWTSPSPATSPRRSMSSTACGSAAPTCGPGSRTVPSSTSAATPPAWPRTSTPRCADIAADQGGLADDKAAAWLEELTRERRFRKDVY